MRTQGPVRPSQSRRVVARRDNMGARARRPALRRRAGHAAYRRPPAPARPPAGDTLTIFSRFLAFMFSARRFQTGPGRAAQRACVLPPHPSPLSLFPLFLIPIDYWPCRLISYGRRARARRLFGCWASVRQSMRSNSYFARVTISKTKFFFCGTLTLFFWLSAPSHLFFSFFISPPSPALA